MTDEPKVPDQDFAGLVDAFRHAVTRVLSLPTDANIEREDAARSALLARCEAMRVALHAIIVIDHHNMGPESRATKIARDALNAMETTR